MPHGASRERPARAPRHTARPAEAPALRTFATTRFGVGGAAGLGVSSPGGLTSSSSPGSMPAARLRLGVGGPGGSWCRRCERFGRGRPGCRRAAELGGRRSADQPVAACRRPVSPRRLEPERRGPPAGPGASRHERVAMPLRQPGEHVHGRRYQIRRDQGDGTRGDQHGGRVTMSWLVAPRWTNTAAPPPPTASSPRAPPAPPVAAASAAAASAAGRVLTRRIKHRRAVRDQLPRACPDGLPPVAAAIVLAFHSWNWFGHRPLLGWLGLSTAPCDGAHLPRRSEPLTFVPAAWRDECHPGSAVLRGQT